MDGQELRDAYHQLTDRQRTVLDLLCRGLPRAEIAARLAMKPRLVDADLAAIYRAFALDASGLTPAQRRLELRRCVQVLRKRERESAQALAAARERPEEEASPPAAPEATEAAEAARPPITIMRRPAPIPAPPPLPAPWRWWSLAALVVLLIVLAGAWRATHSPAAPGALAVTRQASTSGTTSAQPAIATPPAPTPTTAPTARALPPTPTALTPTPAPSPAPNATPQALAGKVASRLPGTPLALGRAVTSVVDQQAKPRDLYAVAVHAGQTLQVDVTAASPAFDVALAPPHAQDLIGLPGVPLGALLCAFTQPCRKAFPVAADGTYTLTVTAEGPGVRYTLHLTVR